MSLKGEINKYSGDVRRAIGQLARQGMTGSDGAVRGTKKIFGYVCAIHEDGDLAGTVDVQEFNYEPDEYSVMGTGHHEGVLLSAIQDNPDGFLIVPMLYSEVVIVQNPTDGCEYVTMYSHAKKIQLKACSLDGEEEENIEISVTEKEKFVETDDGLDKDVNELEPTKNKTSTTYSSTTITDHITSPDDEEGFKQEKTVEHKIITVGDTTITIDGENVTIETSKQVSFKVGGTEIVKEDGKVTIKTDSAKIETKNCKVETDDCKIDSKNCELKGNNVKVDGTSVTITGGTLKTQGTASVDLNGPYNAIKVCPFSGAPHCGSTVSGT